MQAFPVIYMGAEEGVDVLSAHQLVLADWTF